MGRVSKYPEELRERAVRMVAECARSTCRSGRDHCGRGDVEDRHPETLQAGSAGRSIPVSVGVSSQMAEENKALRKQVAELRRANEI